MEECFNKDCEDNEEGDCMCWGISQPALQCSEFKHEDDSD